MNNDLGELKTEQMKKKMSSKARIIPFRAEFGCAKKREIEQKQIAKNS